MLKFMGPPPVKAINDVFNVIFFNRLIRSSKMKYLIYNLNYFIEYNYEHTSRGCVHGHNIVKYPKLSLEECKKRCNNRGDCLAIEYGVSYGGRGSYKPKDCQLQSSTNKTACDGSYFNLDLYVKKRQGRNSFKASCFTISNC